MPELLAEGDLLAANDRWAWVLGSTRLSRVSLSTGEAQSFDAPEGIDWGVAVDDDLVVEINWPRVRRLVRSGTVRWHWDVPVGPARVQRVTASGAVRWSWDAPVHWPECDRRFGPSLVGACGIQLAGRDGVLEAGALGEPMTLLDADEGTVVWQRLFGLGRVQVVGQAVLGIRSRAWDLARLSVLDGSELEILSPWTVVHPGGWETYLVGERRDRWFIYESDGHRLDDYEGEVIGVDDDEVFWTLELPGRRRLLAHGRDGSRAERCIPANWPPQMGDRPYLSHVSDDAFAVLGESGTWLVVDPTTHPVGATGLPHLFPGGFVFDAHSRDGSRPPRTYVVREHR